MYLDHFQEFREHARDICAASALEIPVHAENASVSRLISYKQTPQSNLAVTTQTNTATAENDYNSSECHQPPRCRYN